MTAPRLAFGFLIAGCCLAIWTGGRISFSYSELAPGAWPYEAFISRMLPGPAHALIAALIAIGAMVMFISRRVVTIPAPSLFGLLLGFWALVVISGFQSALLHASLLEISKWTSCILMFLAVIAAAGRTQGAYKFVSYLIATFSVVSLFGIWEYLGSSSEEPGYRIFGGWMNPNAFASVLSVGIPLTLANTSAKLMRDRSSLRDLFPPLAMLFGAGSMFAALWLTGSKGGLLCCAIGVAFFLGSTFLMKRGSGLLPLRTSLFVTVAALVFALVMIFASKPADSEVSGRAIAFQAESAQSAGFRKQLWIDTLSMIKAEPLLGHGSGSYPLASQRYSETEGSKLAHQAYLQLAAESGIPAALLFVGFAVVWLVHAVRRHDSAGDDRSLLRYGTISAVLAGAANGFIESSLSYFGFALLLFALMGLALTLSADGARSDKLSPFARSVGVVALASISTLYFTFAAISEVKVSEGIYFAMRGDSTRAKEAFETAMRVTPAGASAFAWAANLEARGDNLERAIELQSRAAQLESSSSAHLKLADLYERNHDYRSAEEQIETAIQRFPSSSKPHAYQLSYLLRQNLLEAAERVAWRLVSMENSKFFTMRALAEFVVLDSVEARLFLADQEGSRGNAAKQLEMLDGAFQILTRYVRSTYRFLKTKHDLVKSLEGFDEHEFRRSAIGRELTEAEAHKEHWMSLGTRLTELYESAARGTDAARIRREMSLAEG